MRLLIPISLNCLLTLVLYLADKHTPAGKLPAPAKQLAVGLLFGGLSAFASSFGVELLGTVANVRDAAPLTAGLIFGAPAGILSGLIGGLYRWFSVAWGGGTYTRLACTLATILAGLMAAGLRKLMFDDKKPTWGYGICITVVCEVIHMLLILLTNIDDSSYAFEFVRGATYPMILGNSLAVGLSLILVTLLSHERLTRKKGSEQISQTFQRWLLACIVIAFLVTSSFTYILQSNTAQIETQELFISTVNDVTKDIREKSDENLLQLTQEMALEYEADPSVDLGVLAEKYGVIEINVVDESGLILRSTEPGLAGVFNMNSTEQSRDFMSLVGYRKSYVQKYGPVGSDGVTMRKFAGVVLSGGGFLQVGYSSEQFHTQLNEFVIDVTKNRHVGTDGFVAVCDEQLCLVTETRRNGAYISSIGIKPNEHMISGVPSPELYVAPIINPESGHMGNYIYVFTFVEGYCLIAAMPENEAMLMRDTSIYNSVFMQVLIFATLFVFIYVLIKRVIINNLKKINSTLGRITDGDLNVTVDVRSNEEFASLSDDINSTVATLKRYIADAAARIDRELEYAKQIQLSALPTNFPQDPRYGIRAQMIAAKEVGGDFYDFYSLDDHRVAFLAADVSGKGIPAAMFMMTAKTILKDLTENGLPVDEVFTRANQRLCENNEADMFVTAWMGILDLDTGLLRFANAGHNPPLLLRAGGSFEYLHSRAGFVLAGIEGMRYRVNELTLNPGDRLFLYTDGVTEATDAQERLYGEDRLLAFMNRSQETDAQQLLPALKADIDSFVGEAPQFDDITMLLLDFRQKTGGPDMLTRTFPAQLDSLGDCLGFVEENLEQWDCSMKLSTALCVAMEELFVNVANYAYAPETGDLTLSMGFDPDSRRVTFRLSDRGIPFDPLARPDPDTSLSAAQRQIGGLGIFIVKKTMDTVRYARKGDENILTMTKIID